MALGKSSNNALPIGLDLGTSSLKMVQLRQRESGLELVALATSDIPHPCRRDFKLRTRYLAETLRSLMQTHPFEGTECAISLPSDDTFVHPVRIPKNSKLPIEQTLESQIGEKVPFPLSKAVIRHFVAGDVYSEEGEASQEAIVIAAPRDRVDAYLKLCRRAKLDPIAVNVEPCAIAECFSKVGTEAEANQPKLFVDIGEATTQVVLARGTQILFAHNLQIGGDQFAQALSKGMEISIDQARQLRRTQLQADPQAPVVDLLGYLEEPLTAFGSELTQCLRYCESVFKNQGVERAVFVGGQANDRQLCQAIAKRMHLPAQIGDPLARVHQPGKPPAGPDEKPIPQPRFAVAVGLCLGAAQAA